MEQQKIMGVREENVFMAVWNTLQSLTNLTTKFDPDNCTLFDEMDGNGESLRMVTALKRGKADVGVVGITTTQLRKEFIDYLDPILWSRIAVYIRRPDKAFLWTDFLEPFETSLWIALLASMLVLAFCLAAAHELGRRYGNAEKSGPSEYGLRDSLLVVVGIFCLQGHSRTPASWSCRLVYLAAYLAAVVLLAAHSGALISVLTVDQTPLPFTSLEGLLTQDVYRLHLKRHSGFPEFSNSSSGVMRGLHQRMIVGHEEEFPDTMREAFEELCDRRAHYAFMTPIDNRIVMDPEMSCAVVEVPGCAISDFETIALSKRLPFRDLLNYYINRMRRSGLLKVLYQREWPRHIVNEAQEQFGVELSHVVPVFAMLGVAHLLAVVILMVERR